MKTLFADHIVRAVRTFDHLKEAISIPERISFLNILREDFKALGLDSAVDQIDRMKVSARFVKGPEQNAEDLLRDLEARYLDDLKRTFCFFLPRDQAKYWSVEPLFGTEVFERFPSATVDIEEAGKCLACHRSTAAVFHLMRVLEAGLRATARALQIAYAPSWESYLDHIRKQLDTDWKQKSPEWKEDEPFFREVHGYLHAVKLAWRNPTMHLEQRYTPEIAEEIFNAVRGFMRHLATKLAEPEPQSGG